MAEITFSDDDLMSACNGSSAGMTLESAKANTREMIEAAGGGDIHHQDLEDPGAGGEMDVTFTPQDYGTDGKPITVRVNADGGHVGHLYRSGGTWTPCRDLYDACMGTPGAPTLDEAMERTRAMLEA